MVTRPGVICRALKIGDLRQQARRNTFVEKGLDAIGLWCDNQQAFIAHENLQGDVYKAVINLGEEVCPIGGSMRPRQLDAALRKPLSGKEGGADFGLLRSSDVGVLHVKREVADDGG